MMTDGLDTNILITMFSMCLVLLLCIGTAVFFVFDSRKKINDGETHTKTQIVLWYITLVLMFYGAIGYYSLNEFLASNKLNWCLILIFVALSVISFVVFIAFEISTLKRNKTKKRKTQKAQKTDRKKRIAILSAVNLFLLLVIFLLSCLDFRS
ncbi:MAG: hypothetical protein E7558_08145 [Ruminococcaceae bacterium]|nr:hypothetical protein [Oscillospiraceae bacterium]